LRIVHYASALVERSAEAGAEVTNPASFDWNKRGITRFQTLMQMLQQSLGPSSGVRRARAMFPPGKLG
jgi:hypothetical protein